MSIKNGWALMVRHQSPAWSEVVRIYCHPALIRTRHRATNKQHMPQHPAVCPQEYFQPLLRQTSIDMLNEVVVCRILVGIPPPHKDQRPGMGGMGLVDRHSPGLECFDDTIHQHGTNLHVLHRSPLYKTCRNSTMELSHYPLWQLTLYQRG